MGLLGSMAALATYLAVRDVADERLALVAAALYAANPWAVFFTRKTWSEVLPLLTVFMMWAAYQVVVRRRPAWALPFFILLAVQVQWHLVAVLYLPAALVMVLLFWSRWKSRYTLSGVALGLLIVSPYVLVLARQWPATVAILKQGARQGLVFDLRAVWYTLWYASGKSVTALLGRSVAVLRPWEDALRAVDLVTAACLLWGLGRSLRAVLGLRPGWERAALLLIWLLVPVAPLIVAPGAMGIHRMGLLLPGLFILAAISWALLVASKRTVVAAGGAVLLTAVLVVQVGAVLAVYDGVARYPTDGGFGRPLQRWLDVQEGVLARVGSQDWQEVQVLGVDDAPWSSDRAVLDYLLGRCVRLRYVGQGGRPGILVPAQVDLPALVMAADGEMVQALGRFGREELRWPIPGDEWGVRLYRITAHAEGQLARDMSLSNPTTFDNGMRLLGARLPESIRPGATLPVTTYWTYTGRPLSSGSTDMAFNHLLDASGRRWAQCDSFALSQSQWHPGYTLLQWFEIALPADMPPGEYRLHTGMYSWRDGSRAQVIDEGGRPAGDVARLGPIRVEGK